jgi:hypothetical protein
VVNGLAWPIYPWQGDTVDEYLTAIGFTPGGSVKVHYVAGDSFGNQRNFPQFMERFVSAFNHWSQSWDPNKFSARFSLLFL